MKYTETLTLDRSSRQSLLITFGNLKITRNLFLIVVNISQMNLILELEKALYLFNDVLSKPTHLLI